MNIVLLVADTLRNREIKEGEINFLSGFGNTLRLNYYSNAPWTIPAHATMFTGVLPSEHGVNSTNPFFDKENELLSELKNEGFHTVGLSENKLFSDATGFATDFDQFVNTNEDTWDGEVWKEFISHNRSGLLDYAKFFFDSLLSKDLSSLESAYTYLKRKKGFREDYNPVNTDYTIDKSVNIIQSTGDKFLTVNLMPTHLPYTFTNKERKEFLEDLTEEEIQELSKGGSSDIYDVDLSQEEMEKKKEIYKASISYLERKITELIERAPDETVFIILGDHGELLGEYERDKRKLLGHHFGTFKELIDVPFYIYPEPENISVKGIVDHTQLKSIILSIAREEEIKIGKDLIRAEYFGKAGFERNLLNKEPEKEVFKRKSYSIIDSEYKFDVASEGCYLWSADASTENQSIDLSQTPSKIENIANIHYKWRIKDER